MIAVLSVIAELNEDFDKIGRVDIERCQRRLGEMKKGEAPLGMLHNEAVKRMWALAERYEGKAQMLVHEVKYTAETEEQIAESLQKAARCSALEEVARDIFWAQAKDDIGPAAWISRGKAVGVRADWMLVIAESQNPITAILGSIIGERITAGRGVIR